MNTITITIERKKLMAFIKKAQAEGYVYIQAPAGYGKTVFSGYWLKQAGEIPSATLALDEYDNTIYDFCHKLRIMLEELYPDNESLLLFTRHPAFDSAPTEFIMRAAAVIPRNRVAGIVIDDLHSISSPVVQKLLHTFLIRLPITVSVLILSRVAPPDIFSDFFLKNSMVLLSQEQMRFDCEEIYLLYKNNHIDITKKQAEVIYRFTEGWPIEINALLISGVNVPTENMPKDKLESFIKTQVWELWNKEIKDFMLATSIEEELTVDICNALNERTGSEVILEYLQSRGCFLYRHKNGSYHFHRLFREFLLKHFFQLPYETQVKQYRLSGRFYLEKKDFYRAIERFSVIKDYEQIAWCFDLLEQMDRSGFDTERVMMEVRNSLDEEIAQQYPFLFYMMAFTARNDGRIEDFKRYADLYYVNYPRVAKRNPELAHNIFFLYILDFRYTFQNIIQMAASSSGADHFQGVRGSATCNFPLYHRSFRDFSELAAGDIDVEIMNLNQSLGALLGEERAMIIECVRAGLFYERGDLLHAQELALMAASMIKNDFAPESKFCVLILVLSIEYALHQTDQSEEIKLEIQAMIEREKAFYLQVNYDAVIYKYLLCTGDAGAAQTWLRAHDTDLCGHLTFFRLTGNFTTARAHITSGNFDKAIILLHEIHNLCRQMGRTLDIIETEILLSIAYWKKKRGYQKAALSYLEDALKTAQPYGFEQIFINEGVELESMLTRLKNRSIRSDYKGELSGPYVKKLYIGVAQQALHSKGLTGGRVEHSLRFTKQQKQVMFFLCEGYSYRQIGEQMGISFSTVRSHIELIYKKLDVSGVRDAVFKIRELNLLSDE